MVAPGPRRDHHFYPGGWIAADLRVRPGLGGTGSELACPDPIAAATKALQSFTLALLEEHTATCVVDAAADALRWLWTWGTPPPSASTSSRGWFASTVSRR
ncbi:MAG: hypothetical protein DLM61_12455 [Pseudonocardiales bacterium]|nr:MAG: hypothetical protein DLM61_12455 [Pseudonocardiales bacterium]